MPALSRDKARDYIIHRMPRGAWITISEVPRLERSMVDEFREIIKEMIRENRYNGEKIYIELNKDHTRFKIFDKSGFKKMKNASPKPTI